MANVFSHPYQLDEFITNVRVVRWYFFLIFIQILEEKRTEENLVIFFQNAASELVLHCLPMSHKMDGRLIIEP